MPTRIVASASRGIRVDSWCGIDESVVLLSAGWWEPGVADQPLHFVGRGAVRRVRGRYHVLLDHERAEVIAAEAERDLADLHSHRQPARLKIRNIVENDPGKGDRTEVLCGACLWLMGHGRSILRLKRPANECGESARARLNLFHTLQ